MENKGYLILEKPGVVVKKYELRISEQNYAEDYKKFRNAFSKFNPIDYLGISRNPLSGVPKNQKSEFGEILEPDAQDYIWRLEEQNLSRDDIIFDYDEVIKTFKKISHRQNYDIICIKNDSLDKNKNILGFDIGYWNRDHFSLIADTIVIPTWHRPDEKDYLEIANKLNSLNENLLFNTYKEADDFRKYYKTKSWAESEFVEGEFCVILVQKVFYLINIT